MSLEKITDSPESVARVCAPCPGSAFAFQSYVSKQQEWSARTFGDGPRTKGITAHIRKELEEVEAAPHDLEEWIDVMILALDGAWRCGGTPQTIAAMLEQKQAKNFGRTYPKPLSQDHPSFHVKETPNGGS
ncbi:MAG: DUF550 domain-containing protein [Verrucomicrobiota bacterium]